MYTVNGRFEWDENKAQANKKKHGVDFALGSAHDWQTKKKGVIMKKKRGIDADFDFSKARRVTPEETEFFRRAIENTFGIKRPPRGRPFAHPTKKYKDVHIKIHPKALKWARAQAQKRGVGYQTIINEVLLKQAA
jgi:predicted DNA binding CopG/RHH family protein